MGRIFAHWVIVHSGHFFENYTISPHFVATLFHGEGNALILTQIGWAA
jgi:hypothetical protein